MKVVLSGPIKGVSKTYALWAEDGEKSIPIVFLRKPKSVKNNGAWMHFICGLFMSISPEGQAALNEMLESVAQEQENKQ